MRTVLVTGGSGLAGRALRECVPAPSKTRFEFWGSADCDLTDEAQTLARVAALRPDCIVNLAAARGGVGLSRRKPASLLRDNLRIGLNVLEAARRCGVRKVVLCLSNGMYPSDAPQPYREDDVHRGPPHAADYAYAHAKRCLEPMVRAWREQYELCVVGVSPNGIIGVHDRFDAEQGNMTGALIARIDAARHHDEPVAVWGDGTARRELSFAGDVARDVLWVLEHYDDPRILNVGTDEEVSVREVALGVAALLDVDLARIRFDPSRPGGIPRRRTDTSRYRALSGNRYLPFAEALRRTVAGYRAARSTARPRAAEARAVAT